MDFEEKTLKSETIYKGNITEYVIEDVLLPNGKKSKREIVKHPGATAIIPFTTEGKMVFVKQFRKAIEKTILEIPAGKIDATDKNPLETGIRELEEETGYQAETFTFETSFYTSPGFADELLHIYIADGLTKMETPLDQDEDEFIEIVELSYDDAMVAVKEQLICDSKTIFALYVWKLRLGKDN